ncbi:MAG: hypothetical protein NUV81_03010 [bacterium]|nr:hypothetical protein [bacterium]
MEYLPLILIPLLYFVIAFVKPHLPFKWNLCAICVAVSASWMSLLGMWFLGIDIPVLPIGVLMGMSISGLMYRLEPMYAKRKMKHFWLVRLLLILGGFSSVSLLLNRRFEIVFPVLIFTALAIIIITFLAQGMTHDDAVREGTKEGKAQKLFKKLDNCC